eukprot:scaffold1327_cov65-Cyclotella_meneghiniana.AAC.13
MKLKWAPAAVLLSLPVATCSFLPPKLRLAFITTYTSEALQNKKCKNTSRHSYSPTHQTSNDTREDQDAAGTSDGFGLYIHIPFCRRRCNYCDFAIVPIGIKESPTTTYNSGFEKLNREYTDALLTELSIIASSSTAKIPLRSIYFGGGTPSLAPMSTLQEIMNAIYKSADAPFKLNNDAEVTIEMDPGTFDLDRLREIKEMGFNRISLGVQSLNDDILTTLGRVHRSSDVYDSIDMIGQVFGQDANYSIDLISGVPDLTLPKWTETLNKATQLRPLPLHISLYDLQVEKGTAFGKWYDGNDTRDHNPVNVSSAASILGATSSHPALPSAEECAWMYRYASGYLRSKGYEHYEISSYAYIGPGNTSHRSKHNQIYWEMTGQWYAVGLGSTSNVNGIHFARPRALSDYNTWAISLKQNAIKNSLHKPPWLLPSTGANEKYDKLLDVIMTRLRTSDGLDLDWIAQQSSYNESQIAAILRGFELALELKLGTATIAPGAKYGIIRLTDPSGYLFSNNIISNSKLH